MIKNKRTEEEVFLHVCSDDDLRRIWLPACEELHLDILATVGTLMWVSKDYEGALLREMHIMNEWLCAHAGLSHRHKLMSDNWSAIMARIESQPFDELECSFM